MDEIRQIRARVPREFPRPLNFSVPHTRNRLKGSHLSFTVPFPSNFHTSKREMTFGISPFFPTCPFVAHGTVIGRVISTLKSWSVSSCRVSFYPATTYRVVHAVLLVSSRRSAMSCFAMSCLSNHNTVVLFKVPPLLMT